MLARIRGGRRPIGEVQVPGDKSVSHRALILNAVSDGEAKIRGLSKAADVQSTESCLRQLGVSVEPGRVVGVGLRGLREPHSPLDCGNSGTTMRLLAGLLAGQPFVSTLVGDESLSRRPMERVAEPLRAMGAHAELDPLRVGGNTLLHAISYESPITSAQVKSALLLAGLYAEGETRFTEPVLSRNHTELMLQAMGAPLRVNRLSVNLSRPDRLRALDVAIPGDISAAAFFLIAGGLLPGARITLPAVGVNPTRTGLLQVLARIGIRLAIRRRRLEGAEAVADIQVSGPGELRPLVVDGAEAATLIDELPVLAVAATMLPGTSRITGAAELRVKESDRIAAMAAGLGAMGADIEELSDGWVIRGPRQLEGARVASAGDHRVAMALAVAGLLAGGETEVEGGDSASVSYPGFWDDVEALCSL